MYSSIYGNLHRQFKALCLLEELLEEEYLLLLDRDADAVTCLEFSIHELLRQLAVERVELKERMQGTLILDYANLIGEDESKEIKKLYALIDSLEQRCGHTASRNAEFSLALFDQGQKLLDFLHEQINPKRTDVYGAGGKILQARPSAALISGRL